MQNIHQFCSVLNIFRVVKGDRLWPPYPDLHDVGVQNVLVTTLKLKSYCNQLYKSIIPPQKLATWGKIHFKTKHEFHMDKRFWL